MGQKWFFRTSAQRLMPRLDAKFRPAGEDRRAYVPWEDFRPRLEADMAQAD